MNNQHNNAGGAVFVPPPADGLADVAFAQKDAAVTEAEIIARFEAAAGRRLFPGDPMRVFLAGFAYVCAGLRANIDFAGKQNLLKFASDGYLEHLAAFYGMSRHGASYAGVRLEFVLSAALPHSVVVPAGTRVAAGESGRLPLLHFACAQDLVIPAGEVRGQVEALCTQAGAAGSEFLPGQINRLIDVFPFHKSVRNVNASAGGRDTEDIEAFRERVRLAPESFSTAGSRLGYAFWAKTADAQIVDVAVASPQPGVVEIIPLLTDGRAADDGVLQAIYNACASDKRRPLTDHVVVRPPQAVVYAIDATYYLPRSAATVAASLSARATERMWDFVRWQQSALGRDINPSQLTKMLMKAGVKRVDVRRPVHQPLEHFHLAHLGEHNLVFGGFEDD